MQKVFLLASGDPEKRTRAIVQAVTNYQDKKLLAKLSENLGEAKIGINEEEIQLLYKGILQSTKQS